VSALNSDTETVSSCATSATARTMDTPLGTRKVVEKGSETLSKDFFEPFPAAPADGSPERTPIASDRATNTDTARAETLRDTVSSS
jgi:hypothetical protein